MSSFAAAVAAVLVLSADAFVVVRETLPAPLHVSRDMGQLIVAIFSAVLFFLLMAAVRTIYGKDLMIGSKKGLWACMVVMLGIAIATGIQAARGFLA